MRMRVDFWSAALTHLKIAEAERALYDRFRAALEGHLRAHGPATGATNVGALTDAEMTLLDALWLDVHRRGDPDAAGNDIEACLDFARARPIPR